MASRRFHFDLSHLATAPADLRFHVTGRLISRR